MKRSASFARLTFPLLAAILFGCGSSDTAPNFTVVGATSASGSNRLSIPGRSAEATAGSPTSFKVRLYSAYISASKDCSDPIEIANYGTEGEEFELFSSPTLFSATLDEGTYNCLILNFSDVMKFKADEEAVASNAGCTDTTTEFSFDIYREDNSDDGSWVDMDGNSIDGTGSAASPENDRVTAFASTSSDFSVVDANGSSIDSNQFLVLSSPLVVPGQTTYYWDGTDGIANHNESGTDYCWMEKTESGFKN